MQVVPLEVPLGPNTSAAFRLRNCVSNTLNIPICVTLEKALPLFGIQLPHLESRANHLFNIPYTQMKLPTPSTKNKENRIDRKHYL